MRDMEKEISNAASVDALAPIEGIKELIFTVRGVQVMLDRDLARLYQVDTSHLNRQVKRNSDRFPIDFMFQLTQEEYDDILRCHNVTANWNKVRYLPFAMRRFLASNAGMFQRIESLGRRQVETDLKIDHVLDCLGDTGVQGRQVRAAGEGGYG